MNNPIYGDMTLYQDVQSLEQIKAGSDQHVALGKAADQFEVQFLQMVLKNMREASQALSGDDSLVSSDQQQFYQGMYDDQLAATLVKNGSLGLSDSIVAQLSDGLKSKT